MAELIARAREGKVFRIIAGNEVPFKVDPVVTGQEYDQDPFTAMQNWKYHEVIKTLRGQEIINKLKNDRMNKMVYELMKGIFPKSLVTKSLKPHKRDKKLHSKCFNHLSLKDLGIDKQLIYATLVKERLLKF